MVIIVVMSIKNWKVEIDKIKAGNFKKEIV
jgi:hypothetical protein